jgi:hypothetical protein
MAEITETTIKKTVKKIATGSELDDVTASC